ncbi:MAG: alpha/beta fold hydrolase [Bacteroidales bacterium]|nr:alpha/beta fold hydrolase [Bacteroidales bacterium]
MSKRYGIIFVHGIVGNNHIFDFLRQYIPNDYEQVYVALEGHGGDAASFSRTSMSEWKAQVESAVADMKKRCDLILGVGHSMGSLLIMDQAAKGMITSLFLLNPPLRISIGFSMLGNAVKVVTGQLDDPVSRAAKEAYGIKLDFNPLHYYGWPLRYCELFREIIRIRKKVLPAIKCKVQAFLSENDEMVSISSAEELGKIDEVSIITLSASTHYYYSDGDTAVIVNEFKNFLTRG